MLVLMDPPDITAKAMAVTKLKSSPTENIRDTSCVIVSVFVLFNVLGLVSAARN